MDGAAGFVSAGLGQLEGFHDYTLTGKGRITMHQNGNNLLATLVIASILTSTARADHYRTGNFQMRGVKAQRHMDFTTGCHHIG